MFQAALQLLVISLSWLLLAPLGHAQIDKPAVLQLMKDGEFGSAIKFFETNEPDDPESTYWLGLASATTGETEKAVLILKSVSLKWPESPVATDATILIEAIESSSQNETDFVSQLRVALSSIKKDEHVVQLTCEGVGNDWKVTAGVDLDRNNCQFMIQKNQKTTFQFALSTKGSRFYSGETNKIELIDQPFYLNFKPSIRREEAGSFILGLNGGLTTNPEEALESTLKELLESQWMSQDAGIKQYFVDRSREKGTLISTVIQKGGGTRFEFITAKLSGPGFFKTSWEFKNRRLDRIDSENYRIAFAKPKKVTDESQSRLPSMTWPDAEMVPKELDLSFPVQFVKNAAESFSVLLTLNSEEQPTGELKETGGENEELTNKSFNKEGSARD